VVSDAASIFLAMLGALGAWLGGAPPLKATTWIGFWGALAMAVTAGIGSLIGRVV
jgi:VIT1/CCC1 family predicted Fe2+/Mn2+ transporter